MNVALAICRDRSCEEFRYVSAMLPATGSGRADPGGWLLTSGQCQHSVMVHCELLGATIAGGSSRRRHTANQRVLKGDRFIPGLSRGGSGHPQHRIAALVAAGARRTRRSRSLFPCQGRAGSTEIVEEQIRNLACRISLQTSRRTRRSPVGKYAPSAYRSASGNRMPVQMRG